MRKPLIAITGDYDVKSGQYFLKQEYLDAVIRAGAVATVVFPRSIVPQQWSGDAAKMLEAYPLEQDLLDAVDGILFTGGNDVDPVYYGDELMRVNGEIIPYRDAFEIKLAKAAIAQKIPSFGICRGHQVMAVAAGAALCQDIFEYDTKQQHVQKAPTWYPTHTVHTEEGSVLRAVLGESPRVNSYHHQAVKKSDAYPFAVTAWSNDGIIEGLELADHPYYVGVQWHPERMTQDPLQMALFENFVKAAGSR